LYREDVSPEGSQSPVSMQLIQMNINFFTIVLQLLGCYITSTK
jgi:hypothetical protein